MEQSILEFPSSVIEFVGVRVEPTIEEEPTYHVTVGCCSYIDIKTIASATFMQLQGKWPYEKFNIHAFQGITRKHDPELTASF